MRGRVCGALRNRLRLYHEPGTLSNQSARQRAGAESGVDWYIVEPGRPRDLTPLESIRVSFKNLKRTAREL